MRERIEVVFVGRNLIPAQRCRRVRRRGPAPPGARAASARRRRGTRAALFGREEVGEVRIALQSLEACRRRAALEVSVRQRGGGAERGEQVVAEADETQETGVEVGPERWLGGIDQEGRCQGCQRCHEKQGGA